MNKATVICFQCIGTDHKLRWIGQVTEFFNEVVSGRGGHMTIARIKVLKRDDHRDARDQNLGEETVVVADSSLQCVGRRLYFLYR